MSFDTPTVRLAFPAFARQSDLIYLDSAATAQMPQPVLDAMHEFSVMSRANVHRGMHGLAERATQAYEDARSSVQRFLHAQRSSEIVFTKNATEACNLVAWSWAWENIQTGDAIVLSLLEHHSNVVPWLQLQEVKDIQILWLELSETGSVRMGQLEEYLDRYPVKMVSISGQSNVLGVRPDINRIVALSHAAGAKVCIDAAQLVVHHSIDVQTLDCDFLLCSGHKLYGPTGIGVLYGKRELLDSMPAFLGGGSMIQSVTKGGYTSAEPPQKFEAGTPPTTEAVGLAAAMHWMDQFEWSAIERHETELYQYGFESLAAIPGVHILGNPNSDSYSGCLSFVVDDIHPHDLTDILGKQNICLRAGHHCTQPLHDALGITASTRLSLGIYNTKEDIDRCCQAIKEIQKAWSR